MKSFIRTLADFRQAEFPREIDLACPEEYMQKKLRSLSRPYKRTEPASTISEGDAVVLTLESELPRFHRPMVPVNVGAGLYDAELEGQLIGHGPGETFAVSVQGKPVTVTVRSASRTTFPEPTDVMAAEYAAGQEGMEGITTVAAFREKIAREYRDDQRQEALFAGMQACMDYVLTRSDWAFDEDELSAIIGDEVSEQRRNLAAEGLNYDTMTDGEISRSFGVEGRAELELLFRQGAEQQIATLLWLAANHGVDSAAYPMQELMEQDLDWSFLEDYVSGQLTFTN